MAESECCRRRSSALSNMLEWYYRDPVGRTYGPVDSFKLVYLIYANYFEEDTPFASCLRGRMTSAYFDPLRKLLPILENDFLEHNEDVFACQHYMDSMLHAEDDAVDNEIREVEELPPTATDEQRPGLCVTRTYTSSDSDHRHMPRQHSSDGGISATQQAGDQVFDAVPVDEPDSRETRTKPQQRHDTRFMIPSLEDEGHLQPPVAAYHEDYTFDYNGPLNASRADLHSDIAIPVRLGTGAFIDTYHGNTLGTVPLGRGSAVPRELEVTQEPLEQRSTKNYGRKTEVLDMYGTGYNVPTVHRDDNETAALGSMPTSVVLPSTSAAAPSEEAVQHKIVKRGTKCDRIPGTVATNGIPHKAEESADTPTDHAGYGIPQLSPIAIPPPNITNWLGGTDTAYTPYGDDGQTVPGDDSGVFGERPGRHRRHDPVAEQSYGYDHQHMTASRSTHLATSLQSIDAETQTHTAGESRLAQSGWWEGSATHHDASYKAHIPRPPGVYPSALHTASMYKDDSDVPKPDALMPAHHMLIKQRLQSNLRETQAHLSRIPSRKISHVLSQSHGRLFMNQSAPEGGV
ncbi:heat repeat protein, putative [Babesia ovata]|uniref:Heat repeat protein, putative n=1 Tax=Babesia ovata TaxID=189622 RepID=A0A2H6K6W7_9APIC|nr:heat repeat protein, putative [Babesia ovata]GBE58744.1 heat repeat protein, putative [Babesia ovata]